MKCDTCINRSPLKIGVGINEWNLLSHTGIHCLNLRDR